MAKVHGQSFFRGKMVEKFTVNTPYPVGPVHFYKKEYTDFSVLFDTGPNTEEAKNYIKNAVDFSRLKYVFLTHCHVDHYGLGDYILKNSSAEIIMSKYDFLRYQYFDRRVGSFLELLAEIGLNDSEINSFKKVLNGFKNEAPFPENVVILEESEDLLKELGIVYIRCPGHSQSDIVYLIDGYAVSGDVVLRNIFQTPLLDVDVDDFNKRFDNYAAFTKSILKLKSIDYRVFLPGHRDFIDSIDERIIFYTDKLLNRMIGIKDYLKDYGIVYTLKKIVGAIEENPLTAYLKLSEIFFINDLLGNISLLEDSLERIGLSKLFKEKIEKVG